MKIGFASDHAGFEYKDKLIALMKKKGFETVDFGTYSDASCDYPDFAHATMTLNKHQGVRAALCWKSEIARLAKAHNNANVLSMPARFITYAMATRILRTWLETEFEGGRHLRRIEKIPVSR